MNVAHSLPVTPLPIDNFTFTRRTTSVRFHRVLYARCMPARWPPANHNDASCSALEKNRAKSPHAGISTLAYPTGLRVPTQMQRPLNQILCGDGSSLSSQLTSPSVSELSRVGAVHITATRTKTMSFGISCSSLCRHHPLSWHETTFGIGTVCLLTGVHLSPRQYAS